MKILLVIPYLYPALAYGGPAKVIYDLACELAREHKVTIYTSDTWDAKRRIFEREKLRNRKNLGVRYYRNLVNSIAFKHRIFTSFGMVTTYFKERNNYDIVHINDVFILPNLLIGIIAILFNKPYVYSPHGVLDPTRTRSKKLSKVLVYELIAKRVLGKASKIIATSDEEKNVLKNLGFDKILTIFNGLSTQKVRPSDRFRDHKVGKKFTLLYIGKIHPLKGLRELIEALKGLSFSYQLLIAGPDDGELENLKGMVLRYKLKNIFFLGFVNESEKAELFNLSDVFVYPSFSEGFSISILEAMNYGLPVLITKACNFPDVGRYEAGVVLEGVNLQKEIREALGVLVENPNSVKQMGKMARELLIEKYSIVSMAKRVETLYQQISFKQ